MIDTVKHRQNPIQKMEASIALMEGALDACYFTAEGKARTQTASIQKRADRLFDGIRDMKVALYYARKGTVCTECMSINSAENNFCGRCGAKLDAQTAP